MLETVWITYDDLAERLGIERESARQRAKRGRWPRRRDNAGRMQVGVPAEALEAFPERGHEPRAERDHEPGHEPPANADTNAVLARHIERLEQALEAAQAKFETLEQERDDTRTELRTTEKTRDALATQVDALNTILAIERERTAAEQARVEEWKAVADRFASQAERLTEAAEARRGWWPWRKQA